MRIVGRDSVSTPLAHVSGVEGGSRGCGMLPACSRRWGSGSRIGSPTGGEPGDLEGRGTNGDRGGARAAGAAGGAPGSLGAGGQHDLLVVQALEGIFDGAR